jgi:hypothetical protein
LLAIGRMASRWTLWQIAAKSPRDVKIEELFAANTFDMYKT